MLGRILVFLGGVVVVALFSALLAPLFIDWTDFRKDFEGQASRILGKKVTVLGAVEARLLPFPSVTLHDVTVGQDSDGSPLITVARFSMDAELAPFLSGEARIFNMRIEEPKARIRLLADGTLDWLRGSDADIPARTVVLEKVHVSDGMIEFIDEQSGRTRTVTGLNADMSAASLAGPWSADGQGVVDGEAGSFFLSSFQPNETTGAVPVKLRLTPDSRPFDLELDGALAITERMPSYKGAFQAAWRSLEEETESSGSKATGPRVKGQFELTNVRVRVPAYRLELGDAQNPYAVTGEATLDTGAKPEFLLTAEGQQIDVGQIGNGGQTGKVARDPAGSVRKRLNTLISMAASIPIPSVAGRANLSLPAIVAGDTVIRDIRLDLRPDGRGWTVDKAIATLPGRTQVEASGKLVLDGAPSFAGNMLVASTQPSGLSSWITGSVDPAIRQLKSVGFSALVNITPDLQRFEKLELSIGPALLYGRVERQSVAGKVANLSVDLSGNAIDLDAMRAMATLSTGEDAGDSLFSHEIAARLKVGTFTAFGVAASDVDTVFTFAENGLSLQKLNIGDIAGATVTAAGHVEGTLLKSSGQADVTLRSADPGPFLAMLKQHLPAHPMLDRLAASASWYANTALSAHVGFGEALGGGIGVQVGGTANGSRVDLNYTLDDLAGFGTTAAMGLEATLKNPNTAVLFGQAGLQPLPFAADSDGVLALSLKQAGGEPADVALNFSTEQTKFSAKGRVALGSERFLAGNGTLSLETADAEPYLMMNAVSLPQTISGLPVSLSADVAIADKQAKVTAISARAAGNAMSGDLTFDWNGVGLKGEGSLSVDTASLAWLAEPVLGPLTDPLTGKAQTGALPPAFSDGIDLKLKLSAQKFWPDLFEPVTGFTTSLAYKGSELSLDDITGQWLGGDVSGRLMLANGGGTGFLQSRLELKDGDLAAVLAATDQGQGPAATGKFDLTLVGEASGGSASDILSAINGSGQMQLSSVKVARLDTGLLPALLTSADEIKGDITTETVAPLVDDLIGRGDSLLGDVAIPFNITDGVVRIQNVSAGNAQAGLSGDVRLELAEASVDAALTVSLAPGEEALTGADPTFRILLEGPIAAPQRRIDVTDLANFLSLRAFERERRRVETLQASVLEKQRLRREVALYKFNATERQAAREKAAAEEEIRSAEEARLRALALAAATARAEDAAKAAAEAADQAAAKAEADRLAAEAEAARKAAQTGEQPAVSPPQPQRQLQFDSLPGVN